ncbi:MAG TPA: NADH-quinone oxidoreductase subunit H [Candidatus Eisenbacteria bacterium]
MSPAPLGAIAWAVLGPLALLALAPLLDGIGRRIRARLESRAGPPLLQGYVDLAKLAGKAEVSAATGTLAATLPPLALAAAACAGMLLPLAGAAPLGFAGDGLVVLYLLALSSIAVALAGSATANPFGALGASREMVLLVLVEPVVAIALFVVALKAGSFRLGEIAAWQAAHGPGASGVLAALGVLLVLPGAMGRLPFDLPEAEQELMGGVSIEFGGRRLALLRWTCFVRWLVVAGLVAAVFVPLPLPPALALPATLLEALALFALSAAAGVLFARLRADRGRAWLTQVGLVMAFAVAFALIGF